MNRDARVVDVENEKHLTYVGFEFEAAEISYTF